MLISKLNACFCTCFPAVLNSYFYSTIKSLKRKDKRPKVQKEHPIVQIKGYIFVLE